MGVEGARRPPGRDSGVLSRRGVLRSLGALTGTGALLAACGPAPGVPRGSTPTGSSGKTTITYWASWTGAFEAMVKRIASAFMAKNPDVQVNHLVIPGAEMDAKILTGVAADDPPDVAMIWGAQRVYSLADQGALFPLEDALQGDQLTRFRDFVHPPIWELGRYQGKVYAIPQWVQSYCHIWNKDYVQQAGRDAVFMLVIATLLIPFAVTMIPLYLLWNALGQTNTYWPLIIPAWLASPFSVFLLRQFFLAIPQELSESARIDGANELQIMWSIIVPLAKPGLAVVALFQFLGVWGDFLGPLIFLRDKWLFTISLGLRNMQNAYGLSNFGEIMAAATITTLPVILVFFFTQRTFIQGITFSGIKG